MNTLRTLVILNPEAGRGRSWRVWRSVERELSSRRFQHDFHVTAGPGDATNAARTAVANGYELIVAVGGDGTINEVINSPIPPNRCGLAVIPAGSGNDFAKSILPTPQPAQLADVLTNGTWRTVDLAMLNGRYFVNIAGIGFDAEVARRANERKWAVHGSLNYLISILQTLPTYSSSQCRVIIDGKEQSGRLFIAAVGNGRYYGGGIKMCPFADVGDGTLDIVTAWNVYKLEVLGLLLSAYRGTHIHHPKVRCYKGRHVRIEAERPLYIQADGEIIGQTPADVTVVPSALKVRVP